MSAPKITRRFSGTGKQKLVKIGLVTAVCAVFLTTGILLKTYWQPIYHTTQGFIAEQIDARIKEVLVSGVEYTDAASLKAALAVKKGDALVGFDASEARMRVEELPWVQAASISRKLPGTLTIDITEHTPKARFEKADGSRWVLGAEGQLIAPTDKRFKELPLVTGQGGAEEYPDLMAKIKVHTDIENRFAGADYIAQRRWDIYLLPKVKVRLPEQDISRALLILEKLQAERRLLDMPDITIDLRIEDRVILRLPEGADRSQYL